MEVSIDELVVFCPECEHSEFVHSDREDGGCLFSECECTGFDKEAASVTPPAHEPGGASATSNA